MGALDACYQQSWDAMVLSAEPRGEAFNPSAGTNSATDAIQPSPDIDKSSWARQRT